VDQLVYFSIADKEISNDDIADILATARHFNMEHNITGVLTLVSGIFIQVLEGEASTLEELIEKVKKDKRNHSLTVLVCNQIEKRAFPDWSMGYIPNASKRVEKLIGLKGVMSLEERTRNLSEQHAWISDFISECAAHHHAET
jgi:uncharacterized alpha/beta hydrolase family protein